MLNSPFLNGEMSEWLKELAWKACIPHKGIVGSNPTLSADKSNQTPQKRGFCFWNEQTKLA